MNFSLERRHNATFHPLGIFRHHWLLLRVVIITTHYSHLLLNIEKGFFFKIYLSLTYCFLRCCKHCRSNFKKRMAAWNFIKNLLKLPFCLVTLLVFSRRNIKLQRHETESSIPILCVAKLGSLSRFVSHAIWTLSPDGRSVRPKFGIGYGISWK